MSSHTPSKPNYFAIGDFRYAIRRFLNFSAGAARDAGLEPQQYQLLLAIKGLPPSVDPTVGTLAGRMVIRHHSTVELINRLEARRLVRRSHNPRDHREVFLRLTPSGECMVEQIAAVHSVELQTAGRELIATLEEILKPADRPVRKFRSVSKLRERS
jgi:DNA-binding MarR family transcriptional regulator